MLTVAGGSVILARSPGPCEVVWSGLVRGLDQSSCLAELLAITDALVSFFLCHCVTVFYDTFQVVRFATKLLRLPLSERPLEVLLPARVRESGGIILFGG